MGIKMPWRAQSVWGKGSSENPCSNENLNSFLCWPCKTAKFCFWTCWRSCCLFWKYKFAQIWRKPKAANHKYGWCNLAFYCSFCLCRRSWCAAPKLKGMVERLSIWNSLLLAGPVSLVSTPKGAGILWQNKADFTYIVCTLPSKAYLSFFYAECLLIPKKGFYFSPKSWINSTSM